ARREVDDFEEMSVRVPEVKSPYASRRFVPFRNRLGRRRCERDFIFSQQLKCPFHIANDNGNVLEPAVITPRAWRIGPALGRKVLRKLYYLISEPHAYYPHPDPEHPFQAL